MEGCTKLRTTDKVDEKDKKTTPQPMTPDNKGKDFWLHKSKYFVHYITIRPTLNTDVNSFLSSLEWVPQASFVQFSGRNRDRNHKNYEFRKSAAHCVIIQNSDPLTIVKEEKKP
jgi:hypothetical protein